jgi:hypothetical protein
VSDRRSTDRPGGDRLTLANLLPKVQSGIYRRRATGDKAGSGSASTYCDVDDGGMCGHPLMRPIALHAVRIGAPAPAPTHQPVPPPVR